MKKYHPDRTVNTEQCFGGKVNRFFKSAIAPVFGLTLAGIPATGVYAKSNNIYEAEVVKAVPLYKTAQINTPRQECWQEQVAVNKQSYDSKTPEIFGAILGAAVGNEFGKGSGKDMATVAGAVLGGSIGRDMKKNKQNLHNDATEIQYVQKCKTVDNYRTEERFKGYDVTYRYNNQLYSTVTSNDPGSTIKIQVSVTAIE